MQPDSKPDPVRLVLCSATLLEDAMSPSPDTISAQLEAAKQAGFCGISLWLIYAEMALGAAQPQAKLLDDIRMSGLEIPFVEACMPWDAGDLASAIAEAERAFRFAEELGATQAVVVTLSPRPLELEFAITRYRAICDVGADHGVGAMIEFLPWSGIPDLATAWQIVEQTDRPNAGLMIDTWHWQRQPGGPCPDLLRSIPAEKIPVVQLCDSAPAEAIGTQEEAMTNRRLPGEGIIDFPKFLSILDEIGAEPVYAPEVFNSSLARKGMKTMAQKIMDSSRQILRF